MKPSSALLLVLVLTACWQPPTTTPPASFTQAEKIPDRPNDTARPMERVRWVLNYELREFDALWAWLQTDVPAGPERSRAIGAAALMGSAELDRADVRAPGIAAFDEAIEGFPEDARLPLWRGFIRYQQATAAGDEAAQQHALQEMRVSSEKYPSFTLFGITLSVGGNARATPAQLAEAAAAFDAVNTRTTDLQLESGGAGLIHARRIWDTPLAPYNISAMQAMIGDLALRRGDKELAQRSYYTALRSNNAPRWPWRDEVQRRLENIDTVMAGFAASPPTEYALGSRHQGAMGVTTAVRDERFGGRIGNGSCTVCHSHVTVFDVGEAAAQVGWVKIRTARLAGVPNPQPVAFLLPDGKAPRPTGFAIGPTVDVTEGYDFDTRDELHDGTQLIPAEPGSWFAATQTSVNGQAFQGYSAKEFGMQRFFQVREGEVLDFTDEPIVLTPQK